MSKVFISHKNTDESVAKQVAGQVKRNGLEVYLDSVDTALVKNGPDLADYLLNQMGQCQQLIAVVSINTAKSWWVPWEIGVGSEKRFRMATFAQSMVDLPGYLEKWPRLQSMEDIDLYCNFSKRIEDPIRRMRYTLTESARLREERTLVNDFHRDLMAALHRRR